jgi:hypothetical protein
LSRSLSDDGKAGVGVDLAEIRHSRKDVGLVRATVAALHTEARRFEASAAGHRVDFERERSAPMG